MKLKKRIAYLLASTMILSSTMAMSTSAAEYKVVWGDNLTKLSRRFDTTVDAFVRLNNIKNPNLIYVDQILQIPNSVSNTILVPSTPTPEPEIEVTTTPETQPTTTPEVEVTSNIDKAKSLINSFTSGDTSIAENLLTEDYIQHNLAYETGATAFMGSVAYLGSAEVKTTVETIRAFEDGDFVFMQTVYNFAGSGDQVAFDIFRFENGKIAEHWDNLAFIAEANPSGHTQIDGATDITDLDKTEENKTLVEGFVYDVLHGENMENLTSYFDGDTYIQHNSTIADGLSGLGEALEYLASIDVAMIYNETHMVLGQGNFVLSVSEGTFGGEPTSYYDLFRVENGKITEHWDVMETIAEESTWANDNGKF